MKLEPNQTISHYRLVEHIGSGGMGIVWSAVDTKLKRHVAIKILPPDLVANDERRLRFQREAETAASLSHPNIAVIHEIGEHDGAPYLVMELLTGKTLRDTVGKRALPAREWLKYALPIAGALAHAHKSGIVHRDLKSSNVMVTDDGHVKLLDFGLAKVLEPESLPDNAVDVHSRMETISRERTHPRRQRSRHRRLHVPRTGSRRRRRSSQRHFFVRRAALRARERQVPIQWHRPLLGFPVVVGLRTDRKRRICLGDEGEPGFTVGHADVVPPVFASERPKVVHQDAAGPWPLLFQHDSGGAGRPLLGPESGI